MAKIDNSKAILDGVFTDRTVTVPAKTTYAAYTVLGINKDGKLTAYSTDNDAAADFEGQTEGFKSEPSYILAHPITNDTSSPVEYPARMLECGVADKNFVVFIKPEDAQSEAVITALKNNRIDLVHVDYATV